MRLWIYAAATAVSFAVLGAVGQASALPVDRFTSTVVPSDVEQAQFAYGGRNYCWYDGGWRGPGYYWCGYAWRRGFGWGGGVGWHGWHGGGRGVVIGRPGRPGGDHGGGRPGGDHGGRPGGDHDRR
jgi:hypothetical protein